MHIAVDLQRCTSFAKRLHGTFVCWNGREKTSRNRTTVITETRSSNSARTKVETNGKKGPSDATMKRCTISRKREVDGETMCEKALIRTQRANSIMTTHRSVYLGDRRWHWRVIRAACAFVLVPFFFSSCGANGVLRNPKEPC
jgi:hypothetical protein